jgi:hypothetical protein
MLGPEKRDPLLAVPTSKALNDQAAALPGLVAEAVQPFLGLVVADDEGIDGARQCAAGTDFRLMIRHGGERHGIRAHKLIRPRCTRQRHRLLPAAPKIVAHAAFSIGEPVNVQQVDPRHSLSRFVSPGESGF